MKKIFTLAWIFFYISVVTLGGGMAMLPVMQRELVEKRNWLTSEEMIDIIAVMQSLPGMISVNMAILIGYKVTGVLGAIVSAFASVIAPFFIIVVLATGKSMLGNSSTLDKIFLGVRSAVAALILISAIDLGKKILKDKLAWFLGITSFAASVFFNVDAVTVVVFGFIAGLCILIHQHKSLKSEVKPL